MSAKDIFRQFVQAINNRDVDALYALMSKDHRFIDSMGSVVDGRESMKKGWSGYFKMVPDYRIEIEEELESNETVFAIGKAMGTYTSDGKIKRGNYWETIAAWKAIIKSGKVQLWQVIADNEPIREIIRNESGERG
jgi:ketosteroid isomerase-like protein